MATRVECLRALTGAGMPIAAACGQIEFRLAAGPRQFATIAAFRAARRLWGRVAEVCDAPPAARAARLHAISSRAMTTRYDPFVNLLRGTVACFAAGVGGAEVVSVEPYDATPGGDGELGRRLARNTQSLLMDEANLGRVADPAGGSWFVERLTEDLAADAWRRFQEIERAGGMAAALDAGLVQRGIAATAEARRAAVATRREAITGVSEFPDIDEAPPPAAASATATDTPIPALGLRRYAEPFEEQRSRADRHAELTGERPRVLLACLGAPAAHSARAGFAANLFATAGIRPIESAPLTTGEEAASAYAAAGARLACICSGDEEPAGRAAEVARALAAGGAARVYLAGRPGALEADLRAAGVDRFAFAGVDALELLRDALDAAGVAP
jgi:methylmalonyl-CoA mutase